MMLRPTFTLSNRPSKDPTSDTTVNIQNIQATHAACPSSSTYLRLRCLARHWEPRHTPRFRVPVLIYEDASLTQQWGHAPCRGTPSTSRGPVPNLSISHRRGCCGKYNADRAIRDALVPDAALEPVFGGAFVLYVDPVLADGVRDDGGLCERREEGGHGGSACA
jgi:hypothetical protein